MAYLVQVEVCGLQRYLRASSDPRELAGAGELVRQLLMDVVVGAAGADAACRVLLSMPDQVWLMAPSREIGMSAVSTVTAWSVERAPGLDVRGVVGTIAFETGDDCARLKAAAEELRQRGARLGGALPSIEGRFQRLPIVDHCATTELPASGAIVLTSTGAMADCGTGPRSAMALAMAAAAPSACARTRGGEESSVACAEQWSEHGLASIHVRTRGLAELLSDFAVFSGATQCGEYVDRLARFSAELQQCTESALATALSESTPHAVMPLLVRGGSITLLCGARAAIRLAASYIRAFEQLTSAEGNTGMLAQVAANAFMPARLAAVAGIAVAPSYLPAIVVTELAEELRHNADIAMQRLNTGVQPTKDEQPLRSLALSALDFHVLHAANATRLRPLRERLTLHDESLTHQRFHPAAPGGNSHGLEGYQEGDGMHTEGEAIECTRLFGGPYVVSDFESAQVSDDEQSIDLPLPASAKRWVLRHHLSRLERGVLAIRRGTGGTNGRAWGVLLRELRTAAGLGRHEAQARLRVLATRFNDIGPVSDLLFAPERSGDSQEPAAHNYDEMDELFALDSETTRGDIVERSYVTLLLDMMEASTIW